MTVRVDVELLSGCFIGTDMNGAAEWPPSPLRLIAALIAATGTDREGSAGLRWLTSRASPPRILASLSPSDVERSGEDLMRYVPSSILSENASALPGRGSTPLTDRQRSAVWPRTPLVSYCWDGAVPPSDARTDLIERSHYVGYLGAAESPVSVTVHFGAPDPDEDERVWWEPTDKSALQRPDSVMLSVPDEHSIAVLDDHFRLQQTHGKRHRRSMMSDLPHRLYTPVTPHNGEPLAQNVVAIQFARAADGHRVVTVADALRRDFLDAWEARRGKPPQWLTGHDPSVQSPQFVPTPNAGHEHGDGRLMGAIIRFPDPRTTDDVDAARQAAGDLRSISIGPAWSTDLWVVDDSDAHAPWSVRPRRWSAEADDGSRAWATATPIVRERYGRSPLSRADVDRMCRHSGLQCDNGSHPQAVSVETSRQPWGGGSVPLLPSQVSRKGRRFPPYEHVKIVFDQPVIGPVVLGSMSSFGLGLMFPTDDHCAQSGGNAETAA